MKQHLCGMPKFLIVLLANFSLFACSNSAPPYLPTPASVPTAPLAQATQGTAEPVYDLPLRCAQDTAEWFKRNYSQAKEPLMIDGGSLGAIPLEYQNHYSRAKGGCFAVLLQLNSFKGGPRSNSKDYVVVTHTLWDVKANVKLGGYELKNVETVTGCSLSGATCTSLEQWLEMAKPYTAE